jgi:glutamine transport system substrate-binding protein
MRLVNRNHENSRSSTLPLLVSLAALAVSLYFSVPKASTKSSATEVTALERVKRSGVIRAGFGGFPPYSIIEPNGEQGKKVKGFAVDLMEEIAVRHDPPLKVEWIKISWETLRADLNSDRIDVLADGLFQTVALGSDFLFTDEFSMFGIGCAMVRKEDQRFDKFSDLDRDDIEIAVAVGWLSTEFAKRSLKKPKFKDIVVAESPNIQLDEVLFGRVDVAIQDVPTILSYARAHPDKVKALFIESPPATVLGSFAAKRKDRELIDFINTGIRVLKTDGTIERLDAKWQGLGYYRKSLLQAGSGLSSSGVSEFKTQ